MRIDEQAARGWTLMAPPALYALLLLAIPLCTIFAFTFWTQDFLTIVRTFTLENYREAFTDPHYRRVTLTTIVFGLGCVVGTMALLAMP